MDYRIILRAGIADLSGNVQRDSVETSFTTALDFLSIGRLFIANFNSRDVRCFDVRTYIPVANSPLVLGLRPIRLRVVPETEEVYVLYASPPGAGLLIIDGRTLTVKVDSGIVLPPDASDVAVSTEDELVFVSAPEENAITILERATLSETGNPITFPRVGSDPTRVSIAKRRRLLLVALEGAGQVAAFNLPSLTPTNGFPVPAVRQMHTIVIDEERGRAWTGGGLRYAVVDLLNPARTVSFQAPSMPGCLPPLCNVRMWSLILSPSNDRVYILNRRQVIASARYDDLSIVDEEWGPLDGFESDLVRNPRSGEIVVVESRSVGANLIRLDPETLNELSGPRIRDAGDGPINMGVLP